VTYPEPRYHGHSGLTNATYRPTGHDPEVTYSSGGTVHYLATGDSTGGQFGLYRWEMAPAQSGPDAHFHRTISESFYVLSGTIRLYDGKEWTDAKPGDFLFVPEGGIHAFKNESGAPTSTRRRPPSTSATTPTGSDRARTNTSSRWLGRPFLRVYDAACAHRRQDGGVRAGRRGHSPSLHAIRRLPGRPRLGGLTREGNSGSARRTGRHARRRDDGRALTPRRMVTFPAVTPLTYRVRKLA